jgi:pentachlorophenol monooxygenase/3-(3-hydroxy-phenyl)propionate hydroxylase
MPDAPVLHPLTGRRTRLRLLAREGVTVLVAGAAQGLEPLRDRVRSAVPGPVRVEKLASLGAEVDLARTLGTRDGEAWVLRPDAHVAAVLDSAGPDAVAAAARRAVGWR